MIGDFEIPSANLRILLAYAFCLLRLEVVGSLEGGTEARPTITECMQHLQYLIRLRRTIIKVFFPRTGRPEEADSRALMPASSEYCSIEYFL